MILIAEQDKNKKVNGKEFLFVQFDLKMVKQKGYIRYKDVKRHQFKNQIGLPFQKLWYSDTWKLGSITYCRILMDVVDIFQHVYFWVSSQCLKGRCPSAVR